MNRIDQVKNSLLNFQKVMETFPEFRFIGDSILRRRAKEVTVSEGIEIGNILGNTLIKYRELVGYGRGLAASQLGIDGAVFVTYLDDQVQTYINPRVTFKSDIYNFYREFCLSCGIVWGDVKRPAEIRMEWEDNNGNRQKREADGFLARLWLHEQSHLLGELNVDLIVPGTLEIMTSDPLKEVLRDKSFGF